jgi:hypothetical protein
VLHVVGAQRQAGEAADQRPAAFVCLARFDDELNRTGVEHRERRPGGLNRQNQRAGVEPDRRRQIVDEDPDRARRQLRHGRSKIAAIPWPPPMHIVTSA